jgi:uncharacterized protein (DUF1697 family)
VFLRGVNVGGHRVFRPSRLPSQLPGLDLVNIGAAGTFVVRGRVRQADVQAALVRQLPFAAAIVICDGAKVRRLAARDPLAAYAKRADTTRFVSILGRQPEVEPLLPMEFREGRRWLVKVLARTECFVLGVYRRHMKTIGYLGRVDRLFDVPVTTRNWNTIIAIANLLDGPGGARSGRPRR